MIPLYRWSCVETSRTSRGCIGSSAPIPNPSFKDSCIFKKTQKKAKKHTKQTILLYWSCPHCFRAGFFWSEILLGGWTLSFWGCRALTASWLWESSVVWLLFCFLSPPWTVVLSLCSPWFDKLVGISQQTPTPGPGLNVQKEGNILLQSG